MADAESRVKCEMFLSRLKRTPHTKCTTRINASLVDSDSIDRDLRRERHCSHFANPSCPVRATSLVIARAWRHRRCLLRDKSRDVWTGSLHCSSPDTILDQLSLIDAVPSFVPAFRCDCLLVRYTSAAIRPAKSLSGNDAGATPVSTSPAARHSMAP